MLQATFSGFSCWEGRLWLLWLVAKSLVLYPWPLTKKNKQSTPDLCGTSAVHACVQAAFRKHVELIELCSHHVTSPPRTHATCGHSQNVDGCKQCSRLLQAPCFLFDFWVLRDSDTLRPSKLETLGHVCSRSQDTRKVLGLDPTDDLIPAIVTVSLAPDPWVWEQDLGRIPLVLLLSSSRVHSTGYLMCDLVFSFIKWDNTCETTFYSA